MSADEPGRPLILAIDGGNSKADVALADGDGRLLGVARGGTISHQAVGLEQGMGVLSELAAAVYRLAGFSKPASADVLVGSLAGADYPEDVRMLKHAIESLRLAHGVRIVNDTIGALRAGATAGFGVALICGQGINAAAIAPDGRQASFPGVGDIAGDWGGGGGLGMAALRAAVRASDGRGPRTSLERAVPAFFGLSKPAAVTRDLYFERIQGDRIPHLAPVVFSEAAAGDAVARSIIDALADELATMAAALIRRLHLGRLEIEVVLAGGVFRTRDESFYSRLEAGVREAAPRARLVRLDAPPVAGAVLLGLDELARLGVVAPPSAVAARQLRDDLRRWDQSVL